MFKLLIVFGWIVFSFDAVLAIVAIISRNMGDDAAGRGVAFTYGIIALAFVLAGGVALFFAGRAHSWLGATASILPLALPLLLFFGTDVESYVHRIRTGFEREKEGRYPEPAQRELYKAMQTSDFGTMRRILAAHPNLNGRDEAGGDLLSYAVGWTHTTSSVDNLKTVEAVRLLLEAGMDANQSKGADGGSTFLNSAYFLAAPGAVAEPAATEVFLLLLEHGANPNVLREGKPLIFSVWSNPDSVRELLDHGADINARDADGNTPLLFYLWNGFWDAAVLVLERDANIDVQNKFGTTPETALAAAAKTRTETMQEPLPDSYNKAKAALERRRSLERNENGKS
jgi:hypothetical protein